MEIDNLFDTLKKEKTDIIEKTTTYDFCGDCSKEYVLNNGILMCCNCGVITNNVIDFNPEWRFYGNDDSKTSDPTRVGLPTNELLPESSLGSSISFRYGESYDMKKIRNYHIWNSMPYKERSLYNVFDKIQIISLNNGIPTCIIEEAKNLYKQISDIRIHRGSNRKGIIASCIYKACIIQGSPRSAKEIADIFNIKISHMTRGCKKFEEIINMNICNTKYKLKLSSNSKDFIQRFCSKLNIGNNILKICTYVCDKAEEYNLVSKCIPPSIAAGSIYLVCIILNINISKKEISKICKISEVTISKCYKNLYDYHQHIFPKNIVNKLYPKLTFK